MVIGSLAVMAVAWYVTKPIRRARKEAKMNGGTQGAGDIESVHRNGNVAGEGVEMRGW